MAHQHTTGFQMVAVGVPHIIPSATQDGVQGDLNPHVPHILQITEGEATRHLLQYMAGNLLPQNVTVVNDMSVMAVKRGDQPTRITGSSTGVAVAPWLPPIPPRMDFPTMRLEEEMKRMGVTQGGIHLVWVEQKAAPIQYPFSMHRKLVKKHMANHTGEGLLANTMLHIVGKPYDMVHTATIPDKEELDFMKALQADAFHTKSKCGEYFEEVCKSVHLALVVTHFGGNIMFHDTMDQLEVHLMGLPTSDIQMHTSTLEVGSSDGKDFPIIGNSAVALIDCGATGGGSQLQSKVRFTTNSDHPTHQRSRICTEVSGPKQKDEQVVWVHFMLLCAQAPQPMHVGVRGDPITREVVPRTSWDLLQRLLQTPMLQKAPLGSLLQLWTKLDAMSKRKPSEHEGIGHLQLSAQSLFQSLYLKESVLDSQEAFCEHLNCILYHFDMIRDHIIHMLSHLLRTFDVPESNPRPLKRSRLCRSPEFPQPSLLTLPPAIARSSTMG